MRREGVDITLGIIVAFLVVVAAGFCGLGTGIWAVIKNGH